MSDWDERKALRSKIVDMTPDERTYALSHLAASIDPELLRDAIDAAAAWRAGQ